MSLRARIFLLFLALAALPLVALSVLARREAALAVDALIEEQVRHLAVRAAEAVRKRQELHRSDMQLLAVNEETVWLLRARGSGERWPSARADSATAYLDEVWGAIGEQYRAIAIMDPTGTPVHILGDAATLQVAEGAVSEESVVDPENGSQLGTVRARLRPLAFLPVSELTARFGDGGATYILDRLSGDVVYPAPGARTQPAATHAQVPAPSAMAGEDGVFRQSTGDAYRIGYRVSLAQPEWTILTTSLASDFAGPFRRLGNAILLTVLLVSIATTAAFAMLLRRATSSLRALTDAADAVGRGDLAPTLPAAGSDDVGRLATAFALMVDKIHAMIARVEASRQMEVLGDFAARLSHEVRNPLTAIKLNLQALDQDARANRLTGQDAARPLAIALREIDRLDGVLRGVLQLARLHPVQPHAVGVHALLRDLADLLYPQAQRRRVSLQLAFHAARDEVIADSGALKGALLNLLLNALDASAEGDVIIVTTDLCDSGAYAWLCVRIRDHGPGIPERLRHEVFRPFFTTKPEGTGLGLPLAARAAEECGGRLELGGAEYGTEFVLRLPLATKPLGAPAAAPAGAS